MRIIIPNASETRPSIADTLHSVEILHCTTCDVFQQAEALPLWQQDYLQISAGQFSGSLTSLSLGPIQIFRESIDKVVDQHGQPWKNSFAVGVPISLGGEGFWCGERLEKDSIFFLKPNSELRFKTPASSDIYVAAVDAQLLQEYAQSIAAVKFDHILQLNGTCQTSEVIADSFRDAFHRIITGLQENPAALTTRSARMSLIDDIMSSIFAGLSKLDKLPSQSHGQFVHRHIVEKAREYILSRASEPPSVIEICEKLKISRRTLHYSFIKVLGVNPVTFLRYLRLNGARRELMNAHPDSKAVNYIAATWGFWHSGMFSTYYRELFGELPSHTLRRRSN